MPADDAERSLRLFAREVMPRLQALERTLPSSWNRESRLESQ
jgi:hypothetical protein